MDVLFYNSFEVTQDTDNCNNTFDDRSKGLDFVDLKYCDKKKIVNSLNWF